MGRFHNVLAKNIVFYFRGDDPDAVFKYVPGTDGDPDAGFFVKWKNGEPTKIDPEKSNLLADSILDFDPIEKDEFENH